MCNETPMTPTANISISRLFTMHVQKVFKSATTEYAIYHVRYAKFGARLVKSAFQYRIMSKHKPAPNVRVFFLLFYFNKLE